MVTDVVDPVLPPRSANHCRLVCRDLKGVGRDLLGASQLVSTRVDGRVSRSQSCQHARSCPCMQPAAARQPVAVKVVNVATERHGCIAAGTAKGERQRHVGGLRGDSSQVAFRACTPYRMPSPPCSLHRTVATNHVPKQGL
jgi:hypothetical protein